MKTKYNLEWCIAPGPGEERIEEEGDLVCVWGLNGHKKKHNIILVSSVTCILFLLWLGTFLILSMEV